MGVEVPSRVSWSLFQAATGVLCGRTMCAQVDDWKSAKTIYEFSATDIDGNVVSLEKYRGYVCVIVNVASK